MKSSKGRNEMKNLEGDFAGKEKREVTSKISKREKRGEEKKPASAKLQEGSTREGSLNSNDI
jgi:hypothetical protein